MDLNFIRPDKPIAKGINCLTFTSSYFKQHNVDPKKDRLIKEFQHFQDIPIQYMEQVHGDNVESVQAHNAEPKTNTDALFTTEDDIALAALTADCMPIALSTIDGSEFSIIHAGWKGLLSGIIEKSISSFTSDPSLISAWIGPSISCRNYEVDTEFYENFISKDKESISNFTKKDSTKWFFNLQGEAERILKKFNVNAQTTRFCTYDSEFLYSFRKEQTQNRLVTIIWRTI